MKKYEISISKWENGSGYSYTETVDNFEQTEPVADPQKLINDFALDWASNEESRDYDECDYRYALVDVSNNEDGDSTYDEIATVFESNVVNA